MNFVCCLGEPNQSDYKIATYFLKKSIKVNVGHGLKSGWLKSIFYNVQHFWKNEGVPDASDQFPLTNHTLFYSFEKKITVTIFAQSFIVSHPLSVGGLRVKMMYFRTRLYISTILLESHPRPLLRLVVFFNKVNWSLFVLLRNQTDQITKQKRFYKVITVNINQNMKGVWFKSIFYNIEHFWKNAGEPNVSDQTQENLTEHTSL